MSYNNIGLPTARGTGTNGYIQRNLSHVRPFFKSHSSQAKRKAPHNTELEQHENARQIELKVMNEIERLRGLAQYAQLTEEDWDHQATALRQSYSQTVPNNGANISANEVVINQPIISNDRDQLLRRALGLAEGTTAFSNLSNTANIENAPNGNNNQQRKPSKYSRLESRYVDRVNERRERQRRHERERDEDDREFQRQREFRRERETCSNRHSERRDRDRARERERDERRRTDDHYRENQRSSRQENKRSRRRSSSHSSSCSSNCESDSSSTCSTCLSECSTCSSSSSRSNSDSSSSLFTSCSTCTSCSQFSSSASSESFGSQDVRFPHPRSHSDLPVFRNVNQISRSHTPSPVKNKRASSTCLDDRRDSRRRETREYRERKAEVD